MTAGLLRSLGHPVGLAIVEALVDGPSPSSPSKIAAAIEADLGVVAYHSKRLADAGAIELTHDEPVRGAVEHYYRATAPAIAVVETARRFQ